MATFMQSVEQERVHAAETKRARQRSRQESIRLTSNALKEENEGLSRKMANHYARVLVDKAQADRK
jgi:hypothetical protein